MVDFWRMVWQENVQTIVMVTRIKERNKPKCEQYWPDTGEETFGPFCITLIKEDKLAEYTVRTLQIGLKVSAWGSIFSRALLSYVISLFL